ncbi:putative agmatine deiminase 1 [Vallitalea longa]|uniref:Putative agmatine deiminase n=1 Tax=Vallitalea longa TaxID=2936439 RepID=A0A9W5YH67_9FIRM|nr:agmatine deiminase [Vallitalea longa]GKX31093.1 putative agmatine deiminase 1 [Vallitalea longa]
MAKKIDSTPKKDGFRMPGEFEPHKGCWMVWPERTDNWRLGAKPAQKAYADVAEAIAKYEKVTMCVSERQYSSAREVLSDNIRVVEMSNDDAWMRDIGPTFVVNDEGVVRGIDWRFNAWGGLVDGLYFPWDKDDEVAGKVCEIEELDYYSLDDFILEGGSIHTDGDGTAIVTEICLLHESRNPHLSKEEITNVLKEYLGVEKVLWIPYGIYLDETNGHVDNIVHYCAPGVIVLAWTDDKEDPQYELSKAAYDRLVNEVDAKGRKLEIHKLHIPDEVLITKEESEGVDSVDGTLPREEGDRQAASYANFYIGNDSIILPLFGDKVHDDMAMETLQKVFPDRKIEGIYAREIILGGGNIHCITQQQPL